MVYINAIIFGVVQGVTEFLPVSSSGHLVVLHRLISLPVKNELAFDVAMHFATLFALIIYFRQDIKRLLYSWFGSFAEVKDEHSRLGWLIIIATVPGVVFGVLFNDIIESVLRSPLLVAAMLVLVGALFIIAEKFSCQIGGLNILNCKKSLAIGLAQAVALIPGVSRSGITIIAGLATGLKREAAVRFSFLLSIPIILGAGAKKAAGIFNSGLSGGELIILALSFAAAFCSGLFAIKFLLNYAKTRNLNVFAYYRFVLAAAIILMAMRNFI